MIGKWNGKRVKSEKKIKYRIDYEGKMIKKDIMKRAKNNLTRQSAFKIDKYITNHIMKDSHII